MYVLSNGGNIYAIGKKIKTNSSVKTENVNVSKYKEMDNYNYGGTLLKKCYGCSLTKIMTPAQVFCEDCRNNLWENYNMGSGTDNIEEFLEREQVVFTPEELVEFYTQASQPNASIWSCVGKAPWHVNTYGPNLMCNPNHWQVRVPKEWYDDIPEKGIICWVSNDDHTYVEVITGYTKGNKRPFLSGTREFEAAIPVRPEECYTK